MVGLIVLALAATMQEDAAFDRMLRAVERRHAERPDPSDVAAVARSLGFDRERIVKFVRDEVALEAYEGILRGAAGTLLLRGGNDLDRSLLLAALLQSSGHPARLVRGDLTGADQARLLEHLSKPARAEPSKADARAAAELLGVDAAVIDALVGEQRRQEEALRSEVLEAAAAEASRLLAFTGDLPGGAHPLPKRHYWVQVQVSGAWTDVDPSPVELSRSGARVVSDDELKKLRRTVTFKILLTRTVDTKDETVPLLNVGFDARDLAWQDIDLVVNPENGQLASGADLAKLDARRRDDALRKVKIWRPGLVVDGKPYGAAPFDLDGNTYDVNRNGQIGAVKGLGDALNKFGDLFGGGGEKPKMKLVSVDLEVAVTEPGASPRVHRRRLYTPGGRLLPLQSWSFLVETGFLPVGERERRMIVWLAANAPAIRAMLRQDPNPPHFNLHADVAPLLLEFADRRRRLADALRGDAFVVRDRLGLVAEVRRVADDGSTIAGRRSIDILENAVLFATKDGRLVPSTAVAMGVADTALESLLLVRTHPSTAAPSAWNGLSRARVAGGRLEKVDGGVRWSGAEAWWSLDPATGACVGRVPSGAGQGAIEYAWDLAGKVCLFADLYTLYGATPGVPGQGGVSNLSDFCSVVQGTIVRDKLRDHIIQRTREMWVEAARALAGM